MAVFLIAATVLSLIFYLINFCILWLIFAALTDTKTVAGSLTKAKQLIKSSVSFISPSKLKQKAQLEKDLIDTSSGLG